MTIRDDLIAARALIDTPEKLERIGLLEAMQIASKSDFGCYLTDRFWGMVEEIQISAGRPIGGLAAFAPHSTVIECLDRAIAAQPEDAA